MLSLRQVPNIITLIRIALVLPVVLALWQKQYALALLIFLIAGLSDALDGFLARRYRWMTRLGSLLDPLADKILLVTTFTVLTLTEQLAVSLFLVIVLRDVLILGGALAYQTYVGKLSGEPSLLGKVCTFFQIVFGVLLVASLGKNPVWSVPAPWLTVIAVLMVMSCLLSGGHYVWYWSRRALREGARC